MVSKFLPLNRFALTYLYPLLLLLSIFLVKKRLKEVRIVFIGYINVSIYNQFPNVYEIQLDKDEHFPEFAKLVF